MVTPVVHSQLSPVGCYGNQAQGVMSATGVRSSLTHLCVGVIRKWKVLSEL